MWYLDLENGIHKNKQMNTSELSFWGQNKNQSSLLFSGVPNKRDVTK